MLFVPRRHRPRSRRSGSDTRDAGRQPLSAGLGWPERESAPDGEWLVRRVPGSRATKFYRCPGCDHEIVPGTAHVVTWPAEEWGSVADRRHWHSHCWAARGRRGPTARRW
ncbi:hypothetical protein GTS_40540 [Gandjariella thermophila]|uniref:ATP/GTP-binding protein n=1 Tax=Gandjariella thermophila TaxID=1931992 RepID=A0A4D4J708_9PSEU|nr:hypothetical protein GTS_40540 [Gandjariella thermophila]